MCEDQAMATGTTAKGEQRRRKITDAAVALFREQGLAAVRHRAVAKRAGVPLSATTYYFSSIDDLWSVVVQESALQEHRAMQDRVDRIAVRKRGAEATADLLVELVVAGPGELDRTMLMARAERMSAAARIPSLRAVHQELAPDYTRMVKDALRKSGRTISSLSVGSFAALVNGWVMSAMLYEDVDPRVSIRAALLELIDVLAPAVGDEK